MFKWDEVSKTIGLDRCLIILKHQFLWRLTAGLLAFCASNAVANVATSSFESELPAMFKDSDMVALAVAVVRDGKVSSIQTFGSLELNKPKPVNQNTRFRIASLSKAFAATVAVQLESERKLSLESPAILSNPSFRLKNKSQANALTLIDVLSHRVSLPPYAYDNLLEANVLPTKILSEMQKVKPICGIGKCYAYQNVAFDMITRAIEAADDQSYASSVSKRVFGPLNMQSASIGQQGLMVDDNWARSYRKRRGQNWNAVSVKPAYYRVPAAGGINASILDMSKWLLAQLGEAPEVLPSTLRSALHAPRVRTRSELKRMRSMPNASDAHYGLAWRIYSYGDASLINHAGSVEGYAAQIAFLPEQRSGIVLITNSNTKAFWQILPSFLDRELGLP